MTGETAPAILTALMPHLNESNELYDFQQLRRARDQVAGGLSSLSH